MTIERCMTQSELAERWRISEATLERWRTESAGPLYLKLGNQVRYRVQDVEAFEEVALRGSTKIDGLVDQPAIPHPASQRPAAISRPAHPITILLRTGSQRTGSRPLFAGRER